MLTPKQEKFCLEVVKGSTHSDAYRAAYNCANMKMATINRNAKALMDNNKISTRVKELSAPIVAKALVDAEDVLQSILRIRLKAEEAERFPDALKANELLGKHLKMFTDKIEHTGKDGADLLPTQIQINYVAVKQ